MLNEEAEKRVKFEYYNAGMRAYENLMSELNLLQQLNSDLNWFNFECRCQHWSAPWPECDPNFTLRLLGVDDTNTNSLGYIARPVYYSGPLHKATPVPSAIVRNEIERVAEELLEAWNLAMAPYDWAPGGYLYENLMREGSSARTYEEWRSSNKMASTDAGD